MLKKVLLLALAGIFALGPARADENKDLLMRAFQVSEAAFGEIKIVGWAKYKGAFEAKNAMKQAESEFYDALTQGAISVRLSPDRKHLVCEAQTKSEGDDYRRLTAKLKFFFNRTAAAEPYIATIFTGYFDGKPSKEDIEKIAGKVMKTLNASASGSNSDYHTIIYQGYTPDLAEYLQFQNKKININLAFRYNKLEDKTYFYLGTPIISMEY